MRRAAVVPSGVRRARESGSAATAAPPPPAGAASPFDARWGPPPGSAGAAAGTGTVVVRAARGRLCLRPRQKMAEEVGVCGVQGCMSPRVWRPSKLEPEP